MNTYDPTAMPENLPALPDSNEGGYFDDDDNPVWFEDFGFEGDWDWDENDYYYPDEDTGY